MLKPRLYDLETKQFRDDLIHEVAEDENGGAWWQNKLRENLVVVWIETGLDVKDLLREFKYVPELIKQTVKEIEEETEQAAKLDGLKAVRWDDMPHGSETTDPTVNMALRRTEVNDRLRALAYKLASLKNSQLLVEIMLDSMNKTERMIVTEKYINGRTWEKTGHRVCYEKTTSQDKAYKALDKLKELIA